MKDKKSPKPSPKPTAKPTPKQLPTLGDLEKALRGMDLWESEHLVQKDKFTISVFFVNLFLIYTTEKYVQAKVEEDVAVESHDGTILDSWKIYT